MEKNIYIMKQFFDMPNEGFLIREISRKTNINHMTVKQYLDRFVKERILIKEISKPYPVYKADTESKRYLNTKLFFNLEKLRKSGLIEKLEDIYDSPTIVIFGSFAKSLDDLNSDIDIFLLSETKKDFNQKPYEKILERHISIHAFSEKEFMQTMKDNPEFINSICNGITVLGQLEIL